jgi:hypothetical protein
LLPSSKKYGFGIRKKLIQDPDEGVKKALDPGSASMFGTVKFPNEKGFKHF